MMVDLSLLGPEVLQRFDDAVKRYNETRAQAQAKPKAAPRGGVTASRTR